MVSLHGIPLTKLLCHLMWVNWKQSWSMDSTLWILNSRYLIPDSLSMEFGFRNFWAELGFQSPRFRAMLARLLWIPDWTNKNFPDSVLIPTTLQTKRFSETLCPLSISTFLNSIQTALFCFLRLENPYPYGHWNYTH